MGQPELATAEKGEQAYLEAVKQLAGLVQFFRDRPADVRRRHQAQQPTMPIPWGQHDPV